VDERHLGIHIAYGSLAFRESDAPRIRFMDAGRRLLCPVMITHFLKINCCRGSYSPVDCDQQVVEFVPHGVCSVKFTHASKADEFAAEDTKNPSPVELKKEWNVLPFWSSNFVHEGSNFPSEFQADVIRSLIPSQRQTIVKFDHGRTGKTVQDQ